MRKCWLGTNRSGKLSKFKDERAFYDICLLRPFGFSSFFSSTKLSAICQLASEKKKKRFLHLYYITCEFDDSGISLT